MPAASRRATSQLCNVLLTCSNRLLQTFWETGSCTLICTCLQTLRCRRCATGCCHKRWPPTARAACSAMPSSSQMAMSLSSRSTSCWSVGSPTAAISASRYGRKAAWGGAGGQQPTRPDQAMLSGNESRGAALLKNCHRKFKQLGAAGHHSLHNCTHELLESQAHW